MLILALLLIFLSVSLLGVTLVPALVAKSGQLNKNRAMAVVGKVDRFLNEEEIKKMYQMTLLGPVALGLAGVFLFPQGKNLIGLIIGVVLGFILPRMYIGRILNARKQKFDDQFIDALMIMSSSFRGGLSLVQAFESVADEMPEPVKGEFGVVLGENKMGVSLDESLNRLYRRMPSPAMQQMVTAILLARETGGNLPVIFMRIVSSTRERKKIEKNLQTLTVQGKIQAFVMTGLPVFFFFTVSGTNPHFFDVMTHSPMGQKLMIICIVLWVLGALSIWKISTFKDI
ncbi:MAG: type II secretion system F family protein [Candidatus Omnitrophica bacterium]|nr:type II secretion system F family protein [Candidatus Omnitrophota bacterium]